MYHWLLKSEPLDWSYIIHSTKSVNSMRVFETQHAIGWTRLDDSTNVIAGHEASSSAESICIHRQKLNEVQKQGMGE